MHASLVAAPGNVEVNAERDSELDRLGVEVLEESCSCALLPNGMVGQQQNSFLREFLDQLQRVVIGDLGVDFEFGHDCARDDFAQRSGAVGGAPNRVAVGFRLNTWESLTDMMTISSTIIRAAMSRLGLMYLFAHSIRFQTLSSGRKVSS